MSSALSLAYMYFASLYCKTMDPEETAPLGTVGSGFIVFASMVKVFNCGTHLNILSQSSNTMCKGPEFCTTNCCRAIYVGKIVQLILKNPYRTGNTLSGTWFCELLSDWYKTLFGSQDLVSGHKVKKSI